MYGKKQSDNSCRKIAAKAKGKSPAKDSVTGAKLGKISLDDPRWKSGEIVGQVKGRKDTETTRLHKSESLTGKVRSQEAKEKYRNVAIGKMQNGTHPSQKILTCPHCGYSTGAGNAKRHHFDNCRFK